MNKEIKIKCNNLIFDCIVSGDENSELVILLHGFPESSIMWHKLMIDISSNGFYCIAPNMRGYSQGARPKGKRNYTVEKLAEDVASIAKFIGKEKFHLIGHDWGAGVGWKTAHKYSDSILSWTGLSVPHLQAFFEAILKDKEQKKMSRYIKTFQWPLLPEIKIRKNDFEIFRKLWKNCSNDEVENYLSIFRDKQALSASLNYYRGNYKLFKKSASKQILGNIKVPTLFIWGKNDVAVGTTCVEKCHEYVEAYYKFLKIDGGHWLVQTNYLDVKTAIIEHLSKFKLNR